MITLLILLNFTVQPDINIVAPNMNPRLDGPKNDSVTPPILNKSGKNVWISADIIIGTNNVPPGVF